MKSTPVTLWFSLLEQTEKLIEASLNRLKALYLVQKLCEWLAPLALKLLAQPGAAGAARRLALDRSYRVEIGHPQAVTILLVGCGGTGSHAAHILAQLASWAASVGLDLRLVFIDPDRVEPKNLVRQNFCAAEVGHPKAFTLAWRYKAAFGVNIIPVVERFSAEMLARYRPAYSPQGTLTIVVGAVDNVYARRDLAEAITAALQQPDNRRHKIWWIDSGNERLHGQVLAGNSLAPEPLLSPLGFCEGVPLPHLQEPGLLLERPKPAEETLSCAELTLLGEQSAMINRMMAGWIGLYLVRLLQSRDLNLRASFINLRTGEVRSTAITTGRLVKPEPAPAQPPVTLNPVAPPPVTVAEATEADDERLLAGDRCPDCGAELIAGRDEYLGVIVHVLFCASCHWRDFVCPGCSEAGVTESIATIDGRVGSALVCDNGCGWAAAIGPGEPVGA